MLLARKIKVYFFSTIVFIIVALAVSTQLIHSQSMPEIPLEAYEGFNNDSFKLRGENTARPVYQYGNYESNVTTILNGVGKVYVHHVLYFQEEEYDYMEIYSKKPASEFIEGIQRYGHFRMYEHKNFNNGTNYTGKPRVEFVHGLDSIHATTYPLSIFRISEGKEMELGGNMNDDNWVNWSVENCDQYVDPTLFDSLKNHNQNNDSCYFYGRIQYNLEMDLILVDLHFYAGEEDFILGTFESVIFDAEGKLVGHINDFGPLGFVNLTANRQFLYTNTGGMLTEDYLAPYVFRIYDLQSGKVIYSYRSTTPQVSGYAVPNTNMGVIKIEDEPGTAYPERETYIIDHDKGKTYLLHLNSFCQPPVSSSFFPLYCECRKKDGSVYRINNYSDLASISLTEFFNRN